MIKFILLVTVTVSLTVFLLGAYFSYTQPLIKSASSEYAKYLIERGAK